MSIRGHGLPISAALVCRTSRTERHSINIAEAGEVLRGTLTEYSSPISMILVVFLVLGNR